MPVRDRAIRGKYVRDMDAALSEIARVLSPMDLLSSLLVIQLSQCGCPHSRALLILASALGLETVRVRRRRLPPKPSLSTATGVRAAQLDGSFAHRGRPHFP